MLNHFSNENKMVAAVEKVLSPLTKHLGWRTDLSLDNVLEGTELHVARKQNVNPLRFWALVECVNCKDSDGVAPKKAAAYANGTTVYTPTPSSLSAGATNEEALA
jgi:phosphatidylethanolamine/phosphatidyl-N-methylethanolamine N-methyltransferase